jgi:hypothetical protein
MKPVRDLRFLAAVLMLLSGACCAATAPAPVVAPKICVDSQSQDALTVKFADLLSKAVASSGAFTLASAADGCNMQLHVPGNLLRFQTQGGVMVGTVVIVTSSSGRYLSSSVAACRAEQLEPCALRAVAAAKLALLAQPT